MTKKVSVVMCTYNGEKYLREQIDSILGQTYPIYELLIVDDCSVDSTMDILVEYQNLYPNVHIVKNGCNLGVQENFRKAFFLAKGEFIAIADQDDIWKPYKIADLVSYIGDNYLIFSKSEYLFESENDKNVYLSSIKSDRKVIFKELRLVATLDAIAGHDIMFKKELLTLIPDLCWNTYWYDYCLAIGAIGKGKIMFLDTVHTQWRRHSNAVSYSPIHKKRRIEGVINALSASLSNSNKELTMTFYRRMLPLMRNNEDVYKFCMLMAAHKTVSVVLYTIKHRDDFLSDVPFYSLVGFFRMILLPFFICRNIGHWKGMRINEK